MSALRSTSWAKRLKSKPIGMRGPRTAGLPAIAAGSTTTRSVRVSVSAYACPPRMPKVKGDPPPVAPPDADTAVSGIWGRPARDRGHQTRNRPLPRPGAWPRNPSGRRRGPLLARDFPCGPPLAPSSYAAAARSPPGCGCTISALRFGNALPAPPPWRGRSASPPMASTETRVRKLLARLEDGVRTTCGRCPGSSATQLWLILAQRPDAAGVASFHAWRPGTCAAASTVSASWHP